MPRVGEEKVWVEAEEHPDGGLILSLMDITERRRLARQHGQHNVRTSVDQLPGFPTQFMDKLRQGYPVRFKMYGSAYESMLGSLGGLEGDAPGDGLTVVPAVYGPGDYASEAEAVAGWNSGKDFQIRDISSRWDGSYINRQDAASARLGWVKIRFNRLADVAFLDLDETGEGTPRR